MLISTRSRYGLRALVHLARNDRSTPVSLSGIARREDIPIRYLEQILGRLRTADIVRGRRGPGGGYVLSKPPAEISLLDIIKVLETEFFHTKCVLQCPDSSVSADERAKGCAREDRCPTRILWSEIKVICESYLMKNTLSDLACGSLEKE